jgi:hypothetical protein
MTRKCHVRFGERDRETRPMRIRKVRPVPTPFSPLLANIYLDRLDRFVEQELIPAYTRGRPERSPHYHAVAERARRARQRGDLATAKRAEALQRSLPSHVTHNPHYRRLYYVRYADDFLLGFIGPRAEAEEIKHHISTFLRHTLALELAAEKTLITHATTHAARFLSYDILNQQADTKREGGTRQRMGHRHINGTIALKLPNDILRTKQQAYMRDGHPSHRSYLLVETDFTIVARYAQELMGFANYYALAGNRGILWKLHGTMRWSLLATLANKHKTTRGHITRHYTKAIETPHGPKQAIVVTIHRPEQKPLVARFGGYSFRKMADTPIADDLPLPFHSRTTLEHRLQANRCELCGATEHIEVHHIRKLADLNRPGQKEKPRWVQRMAQVRRKTLVVCSKCHDDIHAGTVYRRYATTASRTV